MMRATLRANSSISAEPPLTGSDGALTVTPQFRGSGVGPHGLKSFKWTLPAPIARRIIECSQGASGGRAAAGRIGRQHRFNLALVILRYYGSCAQLLELAAVSRSRGAGSGAGQRSSGLQPGRHGADIAVSAGLGAARLGGSAAVGRLGGSRRLRFHDRG